MLNVGLDIGSSLQEHGVNLKFGHGMTFQDTFTDLSSSSDSSTKTKNPDQKRPDQTTKLRFVIGDPSSASIFLTDESEIPRQPSDFSPVQLRGLFVPEILNVDAFSNYVLIELGSKRETLTLTACAAIAQIYRLMPDATISTRVLSMLLPDAHWVTQDLQHSEQLSRAQTFACIVMFDSGTCNLDP